jgi:proline racemase
MNAARTDDGAAPPLYFPDRISVIDSHTEGEPTRVVIAGWPALRSTDMPGRRTELAASWDHLRSAVVCEPHGHDAMVGALLTEPVTPDAAAGVVFFNNIGYLGMCGHGLIGVVRTLVHLGRVETAEVRIDTPVGTVSARCEPDGSIMIANVPAVCHALDVTLPVPSVGTVTGDIAWGGNWFFITHIAQPALVLANAIELTRVSRDIAAALRTHGITGEDGAEIDHVELTAAAPDGDVDGVNFVLCPGGAYDRSPCGTGTSAKLAVMHARGQIAAGQRWRQRSITGGTFTAWIEERDGALHPHICGSAWVTGESELLFDPGDPLRRGFTAS